MAAAGVARCRCHNGVTTRALTHADYTREHRRTPTGTDKRVLLRGSEIWDTHGRTGWTRADTHGQAGADLKSVQCRFESDWGHVSMRVKHVPVVAGGHGRAVHPGVTPALARPTLRP